MPGKDAAGLFGDDIDEVEFLGRGGSGTVYKATQRSLQRTVAIKMLRGGGSVSADAAPAEATAQASLSWQANVLSLHGSGVTPEGVSYLILEYAGGGSLADLVARSGALSTRRWIELAYELSGALVAAHDSDVIHCDIKPSNILFAADGSSRLADFGIARSANAPTETLEHFEGSLGFAPPELLEGARPRAANDVYGLGLTMLYAATGNDPYGSKSLSTAALIARIHSEPLSFEAVRTHISDDLFVLLERSIAKDPAERPTAAELHETLGLEVHHSDSTRRHDRHDGAALRRLPVILGIGVVMALVTTALAVARWSDTPTAAEGPSLCQAFETSIKQRRSLLERVSADLELSHSPREVVDKLLVSYPNEQAKALESFLTVATGHDGGPDTMVTRAQLSDLTLAEVLRSLSGGKPFLYDGQVGTFDPSTLPFGLRQPAELVSSSYADAAASCPAVKVDLDGPKARMSSAIYSNLANPLFIQGLFNDPTAAGLFDSSTVLLMFTVARPFFEFLLASHWDWFLQVADGDPAIRAALAFELPDLVLQALAAAPSELAIVQQPAWIEDLRRGLARSGGATQAGMRALYADQLRALGITAGGAGT